MFSQVLVTRPLDQAVEWAAQLTQRGIAAVALPLLSIEAAPDPAAVSAAWRDLSVYRLVMFVSPNAATQFFALRPSGARENIPAAWPVSVRVASPGPGTTASLRMLGVPAAQIIEPAFDAMQFDSESLWQELKSQDWVGAPVLVVSGEGGRDWLAQQLQHSGAQVHRVAAYRRGPPLWTLAQRALAEQALVLPKRHLWFFSSSEAIVHLTTRYPPPAWDESLALATHPTIAQAASEAGFMRVYTSRPTPDAVVSCIQSVAN